MNEKHPTMGPPLRLSLIRPCTGKVEGMALKLVETSYELTRATARHHSAPTEETLKAVCDTYDAFHAVVSRLVDLDDQIGSQITETAAEVPR